MSSAALGTSTFEAEVTHISRHGIWVLVGAGEYFLAFESFPWFREAPVAQILNVQEPTPGHLYWPDLDIDLGLATIEHPERFPLVSRSR